MIIAQTPLRVSFLGGGTDFPGFYAHEPAGGAVISAAIDKYVFVIVKERFDAKIYVNYSRKEIVDSVDQLRHELVREAMRRTGVTQGVEITTLADVPSEGTGLGSSSAITVGLLHALYQYQGIMKPAEALAAEACAIEVDALGKPIGKQDQYIAALGGLRWIAFHPDGSVATAPLTVPPTNGGASALGPSAGHPVHAALGPDAGHPVHAALGPGSPWPVGMAPGPRGGLRLPVPAASAADGLATPLPQPLFLGAPPPAPSALPFADRGLASPSATHVLAQHLLLFYTGVTRRASDVLAEQVAQMEVNRPALRHLRTLAEQGRACLAAGDLDGFGALLHEGWLAKRSLASTITNGYLDGLYARARAAGALGGKISGAGGGGFLLLYCPLAAQPAVRAALGHLRELPFTLERTGTRVILNYRR